MVTSPTQENPASDACQSHNMSMPWSQNFPSPPPLLPSSPEGARERTLGMGETEKKKEANHIPSPTQVIHA